MSKLDQFASAFKSAAKEVYERTKVTFNKVLVVTDLDEQQTRVFASETKAFLSVVGDDVTWDHHYARPNEDVGALLDAVGSEQPDLICCYRNLHGRARKYPFSLGAHVDVLAQVTSAPVLLLPFPTDDGHLDESCKDTNRVMVLTDHLTGSDRLIDYGTRLTLAGGTIWLVHLEDDAMFERYIDVIGKIPAIDTDVARERIREQLLKEPSDYIASVRTVLETQAPTLSVENEVRMGHHVADCKRLIDDNEIGLVVMNTKDEEQLAMHGLAYPLAVELRTVPLLML
jgi:hypothetical protein